MTKEEIGKFIRERRVELKITQQVLSDMTDISTPIISAIENGTSNISIGNLLELLDALGLELILDIQER